MAYLLAQLTHLGIASGIVGDRSIGVGGKSDAESRKHAYGSYSYAIESHGYACGIHREVEAIGKEIAQHDGCRDGHHGNHCGDHSRTYSLYDNRGRTSLRGLRYFLCRPIAVTGVILCCLSYHHSSH